MRSALVPTNYCCKRTRRGGVAHNVQTPCACNSLLSRPSTCSPRVDVGRSITPKRLSRCVPERRGAAFGPRRSAGTTCHCRLPSAAAKPGCGGREAVTPSCSADGPWTGALVERRPCASREAGVGLPHVEAGDADSPRPPQMKHSTVRIKWLVDAGPQATRHENEVKTSQSRTVDVHGMERSSTTRNKASH